VLNTQILRQNFHFKSLIKLVNISHKFQFLLNQFVLNSLHMQHS